MHVNHKVDMNDVANHSLTLDHFKEVRVRLLQRGLSLSAYCDQNRYTRQNLTSALKGEWRGPKASRLVQEVLRDVGIISE